VRLQEVFDKVANHLFQQGTRCQTETSVLVHGPNGLKDPVGIFIEPSEFFEELNQNQTYKALVNRFPDKFVGWMKEEETISLLSALQSIHDNDYSWSSDEIMKKALLKVAEIYHLSAVILDQLTFKKEKVGDNA